MQTNPSNLTTVCFRSMILTALGRKAEAREILVPFPPYNPMGLYALAAAGDTITVRARLAAIASSAIEDSDPADRPCVRHARIG